MLLDSDIVRLEGRDFLPLIELQARCLLITNSTLVDMPTDRALLALGLGWI